MKSILLIGLLLSTFKTQANQTINFSTICDRDKACETIENGRDLYKSLDNVKDIGGIKYISKPFSTSQLDCVSTNNCYIFLGFVSDTFSIEINGHLLTNLLQGEKNYISHDSSLILLPSEFLKKEENIITVNVFDLNKYQWGLLNQNIIITNYKEARFLAQKDWMIRTGITLFSAYFLLIFSFLGVFTFLVLRRKNIFYILIYSLVSTLYLISFSEVPREYFHPEVLSGIVHFPLRLLQDLMLFLVFQKILNRQNYFNLFFRIVFGLYLLVLTTYIVLAVQGMFSYELAKKIILIAAPLVAIPMGYGLALAWQHLKGVERVSLVPVFFILFLFQLNDLFLFWQLVSSYFMVKFYIPFVVILLTFIEIRKYSMDYALKTLMAEKVQNAKQIVHDMRSPLSILNILSNKIDIKFEEKKLLIGAIQAIDGISSTLLEQTVVGLHKKIYIVDVIDKVVNQKKVEYSDLIIHIESNISNNDVCVGDSLEFSRIISNLINNSKEASNKLLTVHISVRKNKKNIIISLKDNGIGMPREVLRKVGSFGFSYGKNTNSKYSGLGLGLYNAYKTVERWGGGISISSQLGYGTEVVIKLPLYSDDVFKHTIDLI